MAPDQQVSAVHRLQQVLAIALVVASLAVCLLDLYWIPGGLDALGWAFVVAHNVYFARYVWRSSKSLPVSYFGIMYPIPPSWDAFDDMLENVTTLVGVFYLIVTAAMPWIV